MSVWYADCVKERGPFISSGFSARHSSVPVSLERTPEFPCLPLVLCMFQSTKQRKVCGQVWAGKLSLRKLCPADASKWPSWPDSSPVAVVTVFGVLTKCCCRYWVPHWVQTEPLPARARARACGPRSALDGVKVLMGRDEEWISQAVMRVGYHPKFRVYGAIFIESTLGSPPFS